MKTNMAQSDQARSLLLRFTSFDNLLWSMLTTFQLITLDYWENVYNMVRAISADHDLYIMLMLPLFVCHVSSSSNFFPISSNLFNFFPICSSFSQFFNFFFFNFFQLFPRYFSNLFHGTMTKQLGTMENHGNPPGPIKTHLEP